MSGRISAEWCLAGEMEQRLLVVRRAELLELPRKGQQVDDVLLQELLVQLLWLLVQLRHWCRGKQFTKLKFVELKCFFSYFWTGIVISIGWPQYPSRWSNQQKSNMYICPVVPLLLCAKQNKREKNIKNDGKNSIEGKTCLDIFGNAPWQWQCQNLKTLWKSTAIANK